MSQPFQFLKRPFPFSPDPKKEWKTLLALALFPGLFFLVFQPFGVGGDVPNAKTAWAIMGFGLVTALVAGIFTLVLPRWFKQYYNEFTVGKAIIHYLSMIVVIALGNFFYKSFLQDFRDISWEQFFIVFNRTLLIATIPIVVMVFLYQQYTLKANLRSAEQINRELAKKPTQSELVIESENKKETLRIAQSDLLYISNADNYAMVHFVNGNVVEKKIIRTTLAKIEKSDLEKHVLRCHRSYIVNLNKVIHASGNSRGLQLKVELVDELIPVSRSHLKSIRDQLAVIA